MRILKETELRKVKVLGSGAFGTVYKVRGGAKVRWVVPDDASGVAKGSIGAGSRELGRVVFGTAVIEGGTRAGEWIVGLNSEVVAK